MGLLSDLIGGSSSISVIDENGRYDLKRFSKQEYNVVKSVLASVDRKYPANLRSIGLANEAYPIVYKARYVLFDIVIVRYEKSSSPIDRLAVALAYESKGAYFRKEAISYFESAIQSIDLSKINRFNSYPPMSIYLKFSELYEKEHNYQKAILFVKKAMVSRGSNREYCEEQIKKLEKKLKNPPRTRKSKKTDYYDDFERDVRRAAIAFVTGDFSGIELNAHPNKPTYR